MDFRDFISSCIFGFPFVTVHCSCLVYASRTPLLGILFCIFTLTPVSSVFPRTHLDVTRRFVYSVYLVF